MRISTLAIAVALSCAALPALAQDQPPAAAPVQPKDQSQPPGQDQPQVKPESAPEIVPKSVPKSQDRVEDKTPPAEASAPPKAPSRFTFSRVDKNFLRLDNETGQVAFCSPHESGWVCQAVPEERAALEKEIARLQERSHRSQDASRALDRAAAAPGAAADRAARAASGQRRRIPDQAADRRRSRASPRFSRAGLAPAGGDDREYPEGYDAEGLARSIAELPFAFTCQVACPPSRKSVRN